MVHFFAEAGSAQLSSQPLKKNYLYKAAKEAQKWPYTAVYCYSLVITFTYLLCKLCSSNL